MGFRQENRDTPHIPFRYLSLGRNMNNLKFKKEEFDTNRKEIAKAEALWDKNFPKEYVDFLLKYNGAIVYPTWPNLGPENKTEIWGIERFFSVGDLIIQKQYPMTYTLHNIDEENFEEYNLDPNELLVFAQGDRGIYFLNLSKDEFSQIYIANFSGGDGISKTNCNSFATFLESLGQPEWSDEEFNPNFEFSNDYNSGMKVLRTHLYYTPEKPELGLKRFKEVFKYVGEIMPNENGYPTIAQKYVDDRPKLEYLLKEGCSKEGLLRYSRNPETIKFLIDELKLDINKEYKGRYPLQTYLTPGSTYDIKVKYELMDKMLEMRIDMDWSINGKQVNGEDDLPMIEKLRKLHRDYLKFEEKDKQWWIKNGKPSGHNPFLKSKRIEEKLGINQENENWIDKILNKITRGNNR